MSAVWKKLNDGRWGVEVTDGSKTTGQCVRDLHDSVIVVHTRSGRESRVRLGRMLWQNAATPWNPAKSVYLAAKEPSP